MDDDVASDDFERHKSRFEDEEVPSGSYAEGIVDVTARKTDEWRRDWQVSDHLSHA
jgi:hypothetical protein